MLRFLLFTLTFYFLIRFISRRFFPAPKKQNSFNPFHHARRQASIRHFDQIEEAEYEDLSEKEQKA